MKYLKCASLFFVLVVTFIGLGLSASVSANEAVSFTLEDLDGNKLSLDSQDNNIILFFWATWCPHCRVQIPKLNDTYPEMRKNGITLWAIDIGESKERVKNFLKKYSLEFPVLFDYTQEVAGEYQILGVPTFILISKDRNIIYTTHEFPSDYLEIFNG